MHSASPRNLQQFFRHSAVPRQRAWSALHWAAHKGFAAITRLLVCELGALVDTTDNRGSKWGSFAHCSCGGSRRRRSFVGEGMQRSRELGRQRRTNAIGSCRQLWPPRHRPSFGEGVRGPRIRDSAGRTALYRAVENSLADVIRFLVKECGASVDIVDSSCQTALFSAADYGDLHIARVLVKECGAATDARDSEGLTPLLYAAHNGHSDVVRFLAKECGAAVDAIVDIRKVTALFAAAKNGHLDTVQVLVKGCGATADARDVEGQTPLSYAAGEDRADVVRFLVKECGAKVDVVDKEGFTPSIFAAHKGHLDTVRMLVKECGATVDARDGSGRQALHHAPLDRADVVRLLVKECGAKVDDVDKEGFTPLMLAVWNGYVDAVRVLTKECSANVDVADASCSTALHYAASRGSLDMVRFLVVECGAAVGALDNCGRTPLRVAGANGHKEVVRFLLSASQTSASVATTVGERTAPLTAHPDVARVLAAKKWSATLGGVTLEGKGRPPLRLATAAEHKELERFLMGASRHFPTGSSAASKAAGKSAIPINAVNSKKAPTLTAEKTQFTSSAPQPHKNKDILQSKGGRNAGGKEGASDSNNRGNGTADRKTTSPTGKKDDCAVVRSANRKERCLRRCR